MNNLAYQYHISGAVKSAVAYVLDNSTSGSNGGSSGGVLNESTTAASSVPKVLYSETLYYEDCDSEGCTPQYNGNISRMVHHLAHGSPNYSESRDVAYAYDMLNRLTKVEDDVEDYFDEAFAYDEQGRIVRQARAEIAAEENGGASYVYIPNSNKLLTVSSNGGGKLNDRFKDNSYQIFIYDRDGNMIEDKSKQMTISYDHRGLPVEFKKESSSSETGADSVRLLIAYDGAGSRITKIRERKSAGETAWTAELATHYTGIGSEIREDALNNATKVVVNLPQGLGRYDIENASSRYVGIDPEQLPGYIPSAKFEWYLKNHLGSTMLVYGTQSYDDLMKPNFVGLKSAYDYRAFGEQVDLTILFNDKVTETFTGKELDDETDLSYFGARYLDQMLGMWVSVDAKRQFNSPYLYAGNGTNPINGVDGDGAYLIRKRGGSYEIKTMSKAEAISGWVIKDVIPNFMRLPGLAFNIIKGVIDEKNSDKGFNGRNLQKDAIIKGTEKLVGMENIFVGKGIGAAFSSFDALVSYSIAMTDVDSPEFIAEFDSRMVSNGGDSYNSFPTPEAADAFAKDIQNSINQGNVTVGDPIIENE